MIVTSQSVSRFFRGLKFTFTNAFDQDLSTNNLWMRVATMVPSTTETEDYSWMDELPDLREWFGDRQIVQLKQNLYSITNRNFERSFEVPIRKLEDDKFGIFTMQGGMLGDAAARWPNNLVLEDALVNGISKLCYDGQAFFDTAHPKNDGTTQSNYTSTGGGQAWYLMDTRRFLKPLIFQQRQAPKYWAMTDLQGHEAVMNNRFLYGVDARGAAGYGPWQLAYRSHNPITEANVKAHRLSMRNFTNDDGKLMGVDPNLMVVGASNADAASKLITQQFLASGESNHMLNTFTLVVVPFLP